VAAQRADEIMRDCQKAKVTKLSDMRLLSKLVQPHIPGVDPKDKYRTARLATDRGYAVNEAHRPSRKRDEAVLLSLCCLVRNAVLKDITIRLFW